VKPNKTQRDRWVSASKSTELAALREQIRQHGGLQVGTAKEEVVERLRQTWLEIFEAGYAHVYRWPGLRSSKLACLANCGVRPDFLLQALF